MSKKRTNEEFIEELKIKCPTIIPLEEYDGVDKKIKFRCLVCGYEFYSTPYVILKSKGTGCANCDGTKKRTAEEYIEELKENNFGIIPIEQYETSKKNILHRCLKCTYEWKARPSNILSGFGCPVCSNKKVLKGYNDIATTHPVIASWLENSEDGYLYTYGSGKKVDWICPFCNTVVKQKTIRDVVRTNRVPCKQCSDGVSYPMKFVVSIFEQLNLDYLTEQRFDWCVFKTNDGINRIGIYDIVFCLNNVNYIIEIDGAFHFKDNKMNNVTKELAQEIDQHKTNLALKNGYKFIRILALESNKEYMRNSATSSELSNILDLDKINWDKCDKDALSSYVLEAAKLWNIYKRASTVASIMNKRSEVIVKYLHKATKAGLCDYDGKLEQVKSGKRNCHAMHNIAC